MSRSRRPISAAIPTNTYGFPKKPARKTESRSVRQAKTLPTWVATIPASVIVVARR